jgi:hypothetical protein
MDREPNPHATTENLRSEREIAERSLIRILHVQLFRIAAMEILRMNFYGIRDTKTFDFSTVRVKSDMDGLSFSTNGLGLNEKDMKSLNTQTFSGRSPYGMTSCKIVVPSSTATMPKEIAQGFHSFLCRESSTMLTHKMSTASTELGHYADYLINGRFSEPFEVADSLGFHAGVEGDPVIKRASESIASTDELFRLIDIAIETADDVELSITSKIDGETTDVEDGILALLGASIKGSICTLLEHRRGDHKVIAADVRDLLSKNDFRFAGINRLDHIAYSIFKDMKEEFCDGNINEDDNADSSDNERDKRINDRSDTKERQRKVKKRQKAEKKRHRKLRKR